MANTEYCGWDGAGLSGCVMGWMCDGTGWIGTRWLTTWPGEGVYDGVVAVVPVLLLGQLHCTLRCPALCLSGRGAETVRPELSDGAGAHKGCSGSRLVLVS